MGIGTFNTSKKSIIHSGVSQFMIPSSEKEDKAKIMYN